MGGLSNGPIPDPHVPPNPQTGGVKKPPLKLQPNWRPQIERIMSSRRAAWSSLWWWPCSNILLRRCYSLRGSYLLNYILSKNLTRKTLKLCDKGRRCDRKCFSPQCEFSEYFGALVTTMTSQRLSIQTLLHLLPFGRNLKREFWGDPKFGELGN